MTAIVRPMQADPPPASRLGLALPGLGHLLTGDATMGVSLLMQVFLLFSAAAAGFPRLDEVLFSGPGGGIALHAVLSIASWAAIATITWWLAWRHAFPSPQQEFLSTLALFVRQFRRNRNGMIGLGGVAFLASFTLLAPLLAPFDPNVIDVAAPRTSPGWATVEGVSQLHLMGTDNFGRDLFSRVLYGSRISLVIGFIGVSIAATIGTTVGAVAGYAGGWVDRLLMWVVDLLLSLPSLVLILAIVGLFRVSGVQSIFLIVTVFGFTTWMGVSRVVRSQVLSLKEQDFIQAARALGLSRDRILFRHLIPNAFAPVIVYASLAVGNIIIGEASLSFLGLGVSPPTSTWGTLVNDGRDALRTAPWIAIFPGLCIVWAVMSFNLLGDGLRDALDPKLRGRT
jgi:peptide/nickel transport system permease protein